MPILSISRFIDRDMFSIFNVNSSKFIVENSLFILISAEVSFMKFSLSGGMHWWTDSLTNIDGV